MYPAGTVTATASWGARLDKRINMTIYQTIRYLSPALIFNIALFCASHAQSAEEAAQIAVGNTVRVLTYNINALPKPVGKKTDRRINRITEILQERRAEGTQPNIVVLQEAFGKRCDPLIEQTGYKYVVRGPGRKAGKSKQSTSWNVEGTRTYAKTPKAQKFLGSGLIILSDFEIKNPKFVTFDGQSCAGLDCLANKAIIMTDVSVPGIDTPLHLVTSHFNSNDSAKAPSAVRLRAHQKQTDTLAKFLSRLSNKASPLIIAGDFNTRLSQRYQYFREEINALDAAERCLEIGENCILDARTKATEILYHTADKQFYRSGTTAILRPVYIERNFKESLQGRPLSDHTGYEVHYSFDAPKASKNK